MQSLQSAVEMGFRSALDLPNFHPQAVLQSERSSDSAPISTTWVGGQSVADKGTRRTAPVLSASALSCAAFAASTALTAASLATCRNIAWKEGGTVLMNSAPIGAVRGVVGAAPPVKQDGAGVAGAAPPNVKVDWDVDGEVDEEVAN